MKNNGKPCQKNPPVLELFVMPHSTSTKIHNLSFLMYKKYPNNLRSSPTGPALHCAGGSRLRSWSSYERERC